MIFSQAVAVFPAGFREWGSPGVSMGLLLLYGILDTDTIRMTVYGDYTTYWGDCGDPVRKRSGLFFFFGKKHLFPLQTNGFFAIISNRHILALQTAAPKVREEVKE